MSEAAGSEPMPSSSTRSLTRCFLDAVDTFANPRMQVFRAHGESGSSAWKPISAQEMLRSVSGLAKALDALGVRSGDRVALFAPNCPEWHVADFAIQGLGAVVVPVYFNESLDRIAYILNDSGARVVFVAGEPQMRKIDDLRAMAKLVEHVVALAPPANLRRPVHDYASLIAGAGEAEVAEYRRRAGQIAAEQLVTIIYTSGTTGEPKGVMLSHGNLASNAIDSTSAQTYLRDDLALSILPLAHVYERVTDYGHFFR